MAQQNKNTLSNRDELTVTLPQDHPPRRVRVTEPSWGSAGAVGALSGPRGPRHYERTNEPFGRLIGHQNRTRRLGVKSREPRVNSPPTHRRLFTFIYVHLRSGSFVVASYFRSFSFIFVQVRSFSLLIFVCVRLASFVVVSYFRSGSLLSLRLLVVPNFPPERLVGKR